MKSLSAVLVIRERDIERSLGDFIAFDPFQDCGRDAGKSSCRTVKILITRKPQMCVSLSSGSHDISPGTMARFEKAYIPEIRTFGSYYVCIECCEREMTPGFWGAHV